MRTSKDAIPVINVIPGNAPIRKRQLRSEAEKNESENLVNKKTNSPESNSENISPPSRRKRKEAAKQKTRMPTATDRQLRGKNIAEHDSHVVKSDSLSNLDQSGVNESLDQSKSNEESFISINSNQSRADDSQRQLESTQETINSSLISEDENVNPVRKLRSSRKSLPDTMDALGDVKTSIANDCVKMEHSEKLPNSTNANHVEVTESNAESAPAVQSSTDDIPIVKEDVDSIEPNKPDKLNTDDTALKEVNVSTSITKPESTSDNDEKDQSNTHEEKYVDIGLENQISVPIDNVKSPSPSDSAKGSSIANDSDCTNFVTGDLYWGKIHNFTYWACIVCPDDTDDDSLITRLVDHQMEVHVGFFADNARHSWVKRENLIPYQGLESYGEHLRELKEKFGVKSLKYQSFLPKRTKLKTWLEAVKEADVIAAIPYSERMSKFFELNKMARERNKEERMRRKSLSVVQSNKSNSDNSTIDLSDQSMDITGKRKRSESPISPAFSPLRKIKRQKTAASENIPDGAHISKRSETEMETEYNTSLKTRNSDKNDYFETPQFHQFHEAMKEFVMQGAKSEFVEMNLFVAVKNIWALKTILHKQMGNNQLSISQEVSHEHPVKRLSLRLKDMQQRQHAEVVTPTIPSTKQNTYVIERRRLSSISKPRKVTRPIEEVIDDIFNLDNRYLFDNMSRDPVCKYCCQPGGDLRRCSKNCLSWLHKECIKVDNKLSTNRSPGRDETVPTAKRRSTKSDTVVVSLTPSSRSKLHVTADTDENGNESSNVSEVDGESEEKSLDRASNKEITKEAIVCKECANNEEPKCFVCHTSNKQQVTSNGDAMEEKVISCNMTNCARVYHPSCLKYWPQAKITKSKNSIVSLRCPSHVCHTCVSDDPKGKFQHLNNVSTTKCVKCPATYHMDSTCIPAGSQVLTAAHIICPRHGVSKNDQNVNVSWCFICVRGGQLICCETCPTAVHAECSNVTLDPNESYICDECESGRMPLYGEMVWAKFNAYRWWPAIILPPTEVPLNIRNRVHNPFEFVIRFFGTHDHGWISRRRVYLYVEGDWSELPRTKRGIDQNYLRGVIEAKQAYEIIKAKTQTRISENENKEKLHPQPYVKIRANRAVPPVKLQRDLEKVGKCECDPEEENPCGPDSNCLNRVLYHECNPKICPAGERCQNQMFEARVSPALEIVYAKKERGFGLQCREAIPAGAFIIEYVGEIIDSMEFNRRMQQKSIDRDENYYFLHVEKDYIIDAGPKGNMARFMNHSCDPNCETQKWSVNGLNRVGIFAIKDIPANTELTFNYHWDELLGNDKKVCYCGSENCNGQIGKLSKEVRLKRASSDEQPTSASTKSSKSDQTKLQKKRKSRKNSNTTFKLLLQKQGKGETKTGNKGKVVRRKKSAENDTTDANEGKSAE